MTGVLTLTFATAVVRWVHAHETARWALPVWRTDLRGLKACTLDLKLHATPVGSAA